jgi:signal transduction histidine kinase
VGVVCYGGYCFGILLTGAQKMRQGNLSHKIPTRYLLGSFRDMAEQLNTLSETAMESAKRQMRSERMKTELITNVSHDIKTPLTSIINFVDLLQKPHTPEQQQQYLEVLSRQSGSMKRLIEDLMDLSKASTGNMTVNLISIDATETVNQALGEFADKLAAAELTPVFRAPAEPVMMKADGRLVWRVLSNLLGNTVKYAMPGTRLYIDLLRTQTQVILSLKNVSREAQSASAEELMERFVQGDMSRSAEGSGLGLNIAQSLMEVQGGKLRLLLDGDLFKVTLVFLAE